ncbi:hypothetical protein OIU79_002121, partial [Salix purpurea]
MVLFNYILLRSALDPQQAGDNLVELDDECYYLGSVLSAHDLLLYSAFSVSFKSGQISIVSWVDDAVRRIEKVRKICTQIKDPNL